MSDSLAKFQQLLAELFQFDAADLDFGIISLTPYDDLRQRYEGTCDRPRFAAAHILFMERHGEYDYLARLFADQIAARDGE